MTAYDNIGGVLRKVGKEYDNINGTLREVKEGYDNINGVLRKYHSPNQAGKAGWTMRLGGYLINPLGVVLYGNDIYVIAGWHSTWNGYRIATSPDAITWTLRDPAAANSQQYYSGAFGNGVFIIGGTSSTSEGYIQHSLLYSYNGAAWGSCNIPSSLNNTYTYIGPIAFHNGVFVMSTYRLTYNTISSNPMFYSYDGINWTETTWLDHMFCTEIGTGYFLGDPIFLAVGSTLPYNAQTINPYVAISWDGKTWSVTYTPSIPSPYTFMQSGVYGYSYRPSAPCYGNGRWVMCGPINSSASGILTSEDYHTWTFRAEPPNLSTLKRTAVAYGNGMFISTSANGAISDIIASPDGINWDLNSSNVSNVYHLNKIIYGKERFVALGTDSVVTNP